MVTLPCCSSIMQWKGIHFSFHKSDWIWLVVCFNWLDKDIFLYAYTHTHKQTKYIDVYTFKGEIRPMELIEHFHVVVLHVKTFSNECFNWGCRLWQFTKRNLCVLRNLAYHGQGVFNHALMGVICQGKCHPSYIPNYFIHPIFSFIRERKTSF